MRISPPSPKSSSWRANLCPRLNPPLSYIRGTSACTGASVRFRESRMTGATRSRGYTHLDGADPKFAVISLRISMYGEHDSARVLVRECRRHLQPKAVSVRWQASNCKQPFDYGRAMYLRRASKPF